MGEGLASPLSRPRSGAHRAWVCAARRVAGRREPPAPAVGDAAGDVMTGLQPRLDVLADATSLRRVPGSLPLPQPAADPAPSQSPTYLAGTRGFGALKGLRIS